MVMDPRTVAIHEAGHSVMQWLVGWEADLKFILMRRVEGGVIDGYMRAPSTGKSASTDKRVGRRKLLVLLAGAATTEDPAAQHNQKDFNDACFVLSALFQRRINWKPGSGVEVMEQEPNVFLQLANETCKSIVRQPSIRNAIEAVAELLLIADCDVGGVCSVGRDQIVKVCQRECGNIRTQNEWSIWLDAP